MTPLWPTMLLEAVKLAILEVTALATSSLLAIVELSIWIRFRRKIAYTRYPALMIALLVEAACLAGGLYDFRIDTRYSQPYRMALRAWIVFEVYRFACLKFSRRERARLIGEAITISGTCAWLVEVWTDLTPLENFFIFRGYYHIVLAVALWWLQVWWIRKNMLAENTDHRAYRWGVTRWYTIVAIGGMFVKGGGGYGWIFPFEDWVWIWVRIIGQTALSVNFAWMGWRMTSNVSCLRPEVAYGSAAKAWGLPPKKGPERAGGPPKASGKSNGA